MSDTMPPIDATKPLTVTLPAADWLVIRTALGRQPHDDVGQLIARLTNQVQAAARAESKPAA